MSSKQKKICVIGLGYIGLPTATMLANKNIKVLGVDLNKRIIKTLNSGNLHIKEPGLEKIYQKVLKKGLFKADTKPEKSDVYIITVPTPLRKEKKNIIPEPDISFINNAILEISHLLKKNDLIILESTSPVGTTENICKLLSNKRKDLTFPNTYEESSDIKIAYCPERVMPGNIIKELVQNDRIIGGLNKQSTKEAKKIYKKFVVGKLKEANVRTAEMIKLTENSFRDVNIAFANELSLICEKMNIDVFDLIKKANYHPRVNILSPGPGVGGHCIAVDPWFIVSANPEFSKLIQTSRHVNDSKSKWVTKKIKEKIKFLKKNNKNFKEKKIKLSIYGLTFKADIDDLRESPSLEIALKISKNKDLEIFIVEPNLNKLPEKLNNCKLTSLRKAHESEMHVLLVDHETFLKNAPKKGLIIDTRGIWKK